MPTVGSRRGFWAFYAPALGLLLLMAQGVAPSYAEECKYFSALPDDCAGAQYRKYDNLRDYRYAEIALFAKDPLKKVLYVSTYNTTGLNGGDDSHELGAGVAAPKSGPKKGRQAIPSALGADQSTLLLDGGLARRPHRRRPEFRWLKRTMDGKHPGAQRRARTEADLASLSHDVDGENRGHGVQERIGGLSA